MFYKKIKLLSVTLNPDISWTQLDNLFITRNTDDKTDMGNLKFL